jgi:hypothetical protein
MAAMRCIIWTTTTNSYWFDFQTNCATKCPGVPWLATSGRGCGRTACRGCLADRLPTWTYWLVWGKEGDVHLNSSHVAPQSFKNLGRFTHERILNLFRHAVGLLWRNDQPVAKASAHTGQHNTERRRQTSVALSRIRTHDTSVQVIMAYASDRAARDRLHLIWNIELIVVPSNLYVQCKDDNI